MLCVGLLTPSKNGLNLEKFSRHLNRTNWEMRKTKDGEDEKRITCSKICPRKCDANLINNNGLMLKNRTRKIDKSTLETGVKD